jgi:hypothetical protein
MAITVWFAMVCKKSRWDFKKAATFISLYWPQPKGASQVFNEQPRLPSILLRRSQLLHYHVFMGVKGDSICGSGP